MEEITPAVTESATKKLIASKTIIGILITAVCTILQILGVVDITATEQATLLNSIVDIGVATLTLAGLALALYGRIVATKQIK